MKSHSKTSPVSSVLSCQSSQVTSSKSEMREATSREAHEKRIVVLDKSGRAGGAG